MKNIYDLAPYDSAYSNNSLWNDQPNTYFLDSLFNNECLSCNENQGQNVIIDDYLTQQYSYQNIPLQPVTPLHPVPVSPMHPVPVTPIRPVPVTPIRPVPVTPIQPVPVTPIQPFPVTPIYPIPVSPMHPVPTTPHSIPSNFGPIFPTPLTPKHSSPKSPKRKRLSILLPNNNCPGSTYKTVDRSCYENCRDECLSNNNCKSWTYDFNNNICELKDQRTKCINSPNKISGYVTNAKQNTHSPNDNSSIILVQWIN